jgi:hypothetical protein
VSMMEANYGRCKTLVFYSQNPRACILSCICSLCVELIGNDIVLENDSELVTDLTYLRNPGGDGIELMVRASVCPFPSLFVVRNPRK